MRRLIDSHLDLSWNALSWNRDLTRSIAHTREMEKGIDDAHGRGLGTVTFPEMRRAGVALCFATLLARAKPAVPSWKRLDLDYRTQEISSATARGQLEYYRILERQGALRQIRTAGDLKAHWQACEGNIEKEPIGFVLAMEGADPILNPDDVVRWWERGLRLVGLSHYGPSAYAVGTNDSGPLTDRAPALLRAMESVGMILDMTHLCDVSFFQAIDLFGGRIHASHNNCRSLVPNERQFTDEQLRLIIERKGVIGVVMDNWMLTPGWVLGETSRDLVTMETVADHIDHICQLAGNADHVGIGSDLDGGFGTEETPSDLETIHDLHRLEEILQHRGHAPADIDLIFHGNWLRFMSEALPG